MVHRRYHGADTWGVSGEKKCGMLKNLQRGHNSIYFAVNLVKCYTPLKYHVTALW